MTTLSSRFGRALSRALGPHFSTHQVSNGVAFRHLDPSLLEDCFSWAGLNEILSRGSAVPADFFLCADGKRLPEHRYTATLDGHRVFDLPQVFALMRAGATLIIDSLDRIHPGVRAATDDVMRITGETAACNLFVTFDDAQAFDSHFDEVDTFCVQLLGTKHWKVHGPSEEFPLPEYGDSDPVNCPDTVLFEKTLVPGDVIHVPRGWWHTVRGGGETSLHLTFTFTRRTGYDWLRWATRQALSRVEIRESLDRAAPPEAQQAQAERIVEAFLAEVKSLSLSDFFTAERRASGGRGLASLPWDVSKARPSGQDVVELVPVLPPPVRVEGDRVVVTAADQDFALPVAHHPAIEALVRARRLTVAELAARADAPMASVSALVAALLRCRLVTVSGPDAAHRDSEHDR
ncbi:JmjC domain-containing protein [Streptomyces lancefieldiae]|uniref:Cupin domain-containing protein n=1 Tax=Streptomyces lancefieldiae TaxID=3075520 RepID=A0ABU3AJ81_9ACTN|nr:cupin domain-containing protein [Streptomyces sp. DSM 40712]MDT0610238.1 cupin domain-containing protein [Streptomyces sp. DSM 40712]